MLFWNYWLGHRNTIFYFIKIKQFCYYLNLFSWKYLLSYLCWLSTSGFKCQRPNIFSLARPTREIVHQYVIYRNEDLRPLLASLLFKRPTIVSSQCLCDHSYLDCVLFRIFWIIWNMKSNFCQWNCGIVIHVKFYGHFIFSRCWVGYII